jgi:hypothetical protein
VLGLGRWSLIRHRVRRHRHALNRANMRRIPAPA